MKWSFVKGAVELGVVAAAGYFVTEFFKELTTNTKDPDAKVQPIFTEQTPKEEEMEEMPEVTI